MPGIALPETNVTVITQDAAGKVLDVEHRKNTVVLAGRNAVRDLLLGSGGVPSHIAVGSSNQIVGDGDTGMAVEAWRLPVDYVRYTDETVTYKAFFATSYSTASGYNGVTWREAGLFVGTGWTDIVQNGIKVPWPGPGGILFARTVLSPIVKSAEKTVTIYWQVPVQSGG